jgi:hypothetical protein
MRERMIAETSAFIAWGLKQPRSKWWIPNVPVGRGSFPESLRRTFWAAVFSDES